MKRIPFLALLLATFTVQAATISNINTFSLPGFSTGALNPGVTSSPNNDNAAAASPNVISYSIFFNANGLAPAYFEFNLANSGGTTEYHVTPFGFGVVNNTGSALAGFTVDLGFGVGAGFVRSGAADGLDFDTPDRDPAPQSVRFPSLVHEADSLRWSGAVAPFGQIGSTFSIDVPDGLNAFHPGGVNRFTIRLTPEPVPEPSSALLLIAGLAAVVLRARRARA